MSAINGLGDLYDVLNIHSYPFKDAWPTWLRSYPEDLTDPILEVDLQEFDRVKRDAHARGKQVWLTELVGATSCCQQTRRPSIGPWSQWVDVSDAEQARWHRPQLPCAFRNGHRPSVHSTFSTIKTSRSSTALRASPATSRRSRRFSRCAFLYRTLGDYHFIRGGRENAGRFVQLQYRKAESPERIYAAWSPTGSGRSIRKTILLESPATA